jgi:hypothetical protein
MGIGKGNIRVVVYAGRPGGARQLLPERVVSPRCASHGSRERSMLGVGPASRSRGLDQGAARGEFGPRGPPRIFARGPAFADRGCPCRDHESGAFPALSRRPMPAAFGWCSISVGAVGGEEQDPGDEQDGGE